MSSKQPNLTVRLAAAHLRILELEGRPIEYVVAKELHPEFINSLFQYDHSSPEHFSNNDHPSNLVPMLIKEHRHKTAKIDKPAIAKSDRLSETQAEFRRAMLRKVGQEPEHVADLAERVIAKAKIRRKYRWPKGRKMQSRPFENGHRPMRGRR